MAATAQRAVDHMLVAEVQKLAGESVHRLAEDLTIYQGALFCYTRSLDYKWLKRFDDVEARLRQFVFKKRMAALDMAA